MLSALETKTVETKMPKYAMFFVTLKVLEIFYLLLHYLIVYHKHSSKSIELVTSLNL